jgi:general secretion pathway protein K
MYRENGSALIVALWVILLLSLLIGSFAFDMHIEAGVTSFYRKRMQSQALAMGGIELAKFTLVASKNPDGSDEPDFAGLINEDALMAAENLAKGGKVTLTRELGKGTFKVTIYPTESRYNVNKLTEEQWLDLLEYTGVPEEEWDPLIDAFLDWTDENDLHRVNGAESDDPFYEDQGYKVKNAPLDTIEELSLIKGFTEEILYGASPETRAEDPGGDHPTGLIQHLTTWSSGCINPNAASVSTLMTLPGILDFQVESLQAFLAGEDGELGTEDDELFETVEEVMDIGGLSADLREMLCIKDVSVHRVDVVGEVGGSQPVRSYITAMIEMLEEEPVVASWREELLP